MRYKVGDRVKVKSEFDFYEEYRGKQFVIEECDSSDNTYLCHLTGVYRIWFSEEKIEPAGGNNMQKFNVGDRVVWAGYSSTTNRPLVGEMGKVVDFENGSIGIEFDNCIGGHSCNGIGRWGHCWWCNPTDLVLCVQGGISPASLRPANPDTSTLKNLVATISHSERYESLGKHKGKTISQITTTVTVDGRSASATCDETDYSERQGVLEALGNLVYGDFDKVFNKMKKDEARAFAASCKCKVCGKIYDTPNEARACEQAHADRKKAKAEKWAMYRAAKKRARELEIERMAQEMVKKK